MPLRRRFMCRFMRQSLLDVATLLTFTRKAHMWKRIVTTLASNSRMTRVVCVSAVITIITVSVIMANYNTSSDLHMPLLMRLSYDGVIRVVDGKSNTTLYTVPSESTHIQNNIQNFFLTTNRIFVISRDDRTSTCSIYNERGRLIARQLVPAVPNPHNMYATKNYAWLLSQNQLIRVNELSVSAAYTPSGGFTQLFPVSDDTVTAYNPSSGTIATYRFEVDDSGAANMVHSATYNISVHANSSDLVCATKSTVYIIDRDTNYVYGFSDAGRSRCKSRFPMRSPRVIGIIGNVPTFVTRGKGGARSIQKTTSKPLSYQGDYLPLSAIWDN